MATIELLPLSEHLDLQQIEATRQAIAEVTSEPLVLDSNDDVVLENNTVDEYLFTDFRDQMEANGLDADIYVPIDFEDVVEAGGIRIGSSHALQLVLDSLREDFLIDDDADDTLDENELDDDSAEPDDEEASDEEGNGDTYDEGPQEDNSLLGSEDLGIELKDYQFQQIWRLMRRAAKQSILSNLALVVHR